MSTHKKLMDLYSDSDVFHKLVVEIHNSSCQTLEHIPLEVALQAMLQVWESCHKSTNKECLSQHLSQHLSQNIHKDLGA